ncbi:MAG: hypothetical protein Pg6C_01010 [Treponemataceae bacterium]|nr:MAG: hypothetical protein Pg6C_01010 [Treponemataceae bacterium]
MHLPDIQLDTALALLPQESKFTSMNADGGRVNALGGTREDESFQKLLEKAMNEARAADKARDDERSARAKEAQTQSGKPGESRQADEARRGADKANSAEKSERSEIAKHKETSGQTANREYLAETEDAITPAEQFAPAETAFAVKFRALADTRLDELAVAESSVLEASPENEADTAETAFSGQKTASGNDSLLLDALAAAQEQQIAPAAQTEASTDSAEHESREDLNAKKDSSIKRAETVAALFNAQTLNTDAAVISQAAQTNNGVDGGVALSETSGAAKKRDFFEGDKPLFTIIDERADFSREKSSHITASHEGNHAELQLSLSNAAKDARFSLDAAQNPGSAESKFAAMLSQEIKNNASEFVKAGSIILRGNDTGSIRLALHPENLGDVKILLQLTDNNIAARITVATKEAYDAFKSSIDSLKQAFNDSGFSTGDFNLSWTGGGAQGNAQHNNHGQDPSRQVFERSLAQYTGGMPDFDSELEERSFTGTGGYAPPRLNAVNIMA